MKREDVLKEVGPNKKKTIVYAIFTIIFIISLIFYNVNILYPIFGFGMLLFFFIDDYTRRVLNYEFYLKYGNNYKKEIMIWIYGSETKRLKERANIRKIFYAWLIFCIILPIINISYLFIVFFGTILLLGFFLNTFDIPKEIRGT